MKEKTCLKDCPRCTENAGAPCGGCGGGAVNLPLSVEERLLLERFEELPFLPVVWDAAERKFTIPDCGMPESRAGFALSLLRGRGYADVDLQTPLQNYPYPPRPGCLFGSAALTARGQEALDDLEYGG